MLAFCHIKKTAGTTLTSILRRSFGTRHFDSRAIRRETGFITADELQRVRNVYWNLQSIAGHGISPASDLHERFRSIRYYTFLREPIARTISHFSFLVRCRVIDVNAANSQSLLRTFIHKSRNVQTRHLAGEENAERAAELIQQRVGFVGLVERFDESLLLLKHWSQCAELDISYQPQNVSPKGEVKHQNLLREWIKRDGEIAALVVEANREDLRLYRWVCDEVYPAQCREYGADLADDVKRFVEANRQMRFWINDSLLGKAYRGLVFRPWESVTRMLRAG